MNKETVYKKLYENLDPKEVYVLCATILSDAYDDEIIEDVLNGRLKNGRINKTNKTKSKGDK